MKEESLFWSKGRCIKEEITHPFSLLRRETTFPDETAKALVLSPCSIRGITG